MPLLLICFFIPRESSDSEIKKEKLEMVSTSNITMKLKGGERMFFNYTDIYFQLEQLIFSNPGKSDTIITHKFQSKFVNILNWSYIEMSDQNRTAHSFYIYLKPGDSLVFALRNGRDLVIDTIQATRLGSCAHGFYYDDFVNHFFFKKGARHKIDFIEFYSLLERTHKAENERIEILVKNNAISHHTASVWLYNSEVLYYKYFFQFISGEDKLNNQMSVIYNSHLKKAMELFRQQPPILSYNLIQIFNGIIRVQLMNENKDFNDYSQVIKKAIEIAPNPLRASLLCGMYRGAAEEEDGEQILSNYIITEYPNTIYSTYIEKIKNKAVAISQIKIGDTLISDSNQVIPWKDYLLQNDKLLVVDYWASWCAPCRALFPALDSVKKQFVDKNIEFVSINIDEDINDWRITSIAESKYLKANNYYLLQNREASLIKRYAIHSIPRIMIFKNGKVVSNSFFIPSEPDFINKLNNILSAYN